MTLSPSRSFKNFQDSPNGRPNASGKIVVNSLFNKFILPFCFVLFFGVSIYLYIRIGAKTSFEFASSNVELSSHSHIFASHWLQHQAREHSNVINLFHPGISANEISLADPFSLSTGINVWDMYEPVLSCPDIIRVGKIGEGGKWLCGMNYLASQPACVMYSFGISTDMSFEVEILLRTNCIIHAFDPTVGKLPYHNLKPEVLSALTAAQRARIRFHKTAMGEKSGSSELHSFNEQFLDIMHRLNHSFIDLLKVDIEGGEWSVFNGMFRQSKLSSGTSAPLPVGQLLIELHYRSMDETESFFTGAAQGGLLPFSREINLQPCIGGGKPVAVEYSFINPALYYAGQSAHSVVPAAHSASWHTPINAVIYFLTQKARVPRMCETLAKLYQHFWQDYPVYPVVIFHDDLTASDERTLHAAVPFMTLRFVKVVLSTPEGLIRSGVKIPDRTVCAPGSSTLGYRHMCRFHATLVHKYLADLGYLKLEYIMRMDDDGELTSPIGYDLFRYMKENNKKYGFVNMVADDPVCVTDLWEKSEVYFNASVRATRNQGESLFSVWPKGVVFYNNFEISAVSLWHDPLWQGYMNYIDELGGIYTLRWGDAPLHTIGVTMLLSKLQIHAFTDIGYKHEPFVDQQPKGLPMPHMDPFLGPNVECHYYDKWMCFSVAAGQNFSMNSSTNSSIGAFSRNVSLHSLHSLFQLNSINYANAFAPAAGSSQKQLISSSAAGEAALFSFGHGGREALLAATVQSLFDNYLAAYPAQVVVFYNEKGTFSTQKVERALKGSKVLPLLSFKRVALPSSAGFQVNNLCSSSDLEVRESSLFLRVGSVKLLQSSGFSWIFRFGDDAKLRAPVRYNIFEHMRRHKKLFGFIDSVNDRAECVDDAWQLGTHLCEQLRQNNSTTSALSAPQASQHLRALRKKGRKAASSSIDSTVDTIDSNLCSENMAEWPARKVILTNFEVSHVSVWSSPVCLSLFDTVNPAVVKDKGSQTVLYGDSVLHTLCVAMSLPRERIEHFQDIEYRFNWKTAEHIQMHTADPRDRTASYAVESLELFDRAFATQRIGWLGGDVAASVALPNEFDVSLPPNKLLWLFGDSIVGVSTAERRIKEHSRMISNTIGVSVLAAIPADTPSDCTSTARATPRPVEHLTYHWKTNQEGDPAAVLTIPPLNNCAVEQQRVWPIAGFSVLDTAVSDQPAKATKLFLLADVVCLNGNSAEKLLFEDYETAVFVVHNPYDLPQTWRYDYKVFPDLGKAYLKWISVVSATGKSIAQSTDELYLLGAYRGKRHGPGHQVLGKISVKALLQLDLQSVRMLTKGSETVVTAGSASNWQEVYLSGAAGVASTAGESPISSSSLLHPHSLFEPLLSEASLYFDAARREWQVISLLFLDKHVQLCRTQDIASVTSAWNCSFVAPVDSKWLDQSELITYAAKVHPHLLPPRISCPAQQHTVTAVDLVVTYVSNVLNDVNLLYQPGLKDAYTPKFVHIFGG